MGLIMRAVGLASVLLAPASLQSASASCRSKPCSLGLEFTATPVPEQYMTAEVFDAGERGYYVVIETDGHEGYARVKAVIATPYLVASADAGLIHINDPEDEDGDVVIAYLK